MQTHTPDINISQNIWKELGFGFRLTLKFVQLRATSDRHPCTYFFQATGTPVYTWNLLSSNQIYSKISKSSWSDNCKHIFKFWIELDGISSTSVSGFWLCGIKGKSKNNLRPFYFAWLKLRLPPWLWPGLDPTKEIHESVGGLLLSLSLILEISTENLCV